MLDNKQIQNNWPKIKALILSHWNKLSEAEVEKTHGSMNSLGKLVQITYGNKEDFDTNYERLCMSVLSPVASVSKSDRTLETIVAESAMDKDRDDMYLAGPGGVTRNAEISGIEHSPHYTTGEESFNEEGADGFHNVDRSLGRFPKDPGHKLEEELLKPDLKGMEATDTQTTLMRDFGTNIKSPLKSPNQLKNKTTINKLATDEFTTNQDPHREDITLGRSNSSANTTSPSALSSSEAASKDTKKL